MRLVKFLLLSVSCIFQFSFAQGNFKTECSLIEHYRSDTTSSLYFFYPKDQKDKKSIPALVFFFGGGWTHGSPEQFLQHAKYFSERGLIVVLVNYRTGDKNETTPFDAVSDAKSAMRYVRANAKRLKINPDKIAAGGGSAGGHLAAACAFVDAYNYESDNLKISPVPNALVLFNPVFNNGPDNYGYDRVKDDYRNFSPYHNLHKNGPPTLIMLGTEDKLIPIKTASGYKDKMISLGNRCDLKLYEGQGHGFFNFRNTEFYNKTISDADSFLVSIKYLTKRSKTSK